MNEENVEEAKKLEIQIYTVVRAYAAEHEDKQSIAVICQALSSLLCNVCGASGISKANMLHALNLTYEDTEESLEEYRKMYNDDVR